MKRNQKGFTVIEALIILVVAAVIGFGGWWVYDRNHKNKTTKNNTPATTYLTVTEWGVKVPVDSKTAGLSYTITAASKGFGAVANFTDTALKAVSAAGCYNTFVTRGLATDYVPNEISQKSSSLTYKSIYDAQTKSGFVKTTGVYAYIGKYYYVPPQVGRASCAKVSDDTKEQQRLQTAEDNARADIFEALNKMTAQ